MFTVKPGIRIGSLNVGFGQDLKWFTVNVGKNLRKTSGKPPTTMPIDWTLSDANLRYLKE